MSKNLSRGRCAASLAVAVLAIVAAPRAQDRSLLTPVPSVDQRVVAWDQVQRAGDRSITRTQFVRVNADALRAVTDATPLGKQFAFEVDLFGNPVQFVLRPFGNQLGYKLVRGHLLDGRMSTIVFAVGAQATAGVIEFDDVRYSLNYTGVADVHALVEMDPRAPLDKPECLTGDGPGVQQVPGLDSVDTSELLPASPDALTTIDVAVFYTPAARNQAGGTSAIESQIASRLGTANVGNQNSLVDMSYRLVHTGETNYVETGTQTDVNRFRNTTDGFMDEVHAIRNAVGADLMSLIISQSAQFCGIAYNVMCFNSTAFASQAFSVTVRTCFGQHTFHHELGHTQGCAHDRPNAGCGTFSYSFGWRTTNNAWRSVMAYSPGTRVNLWSNPNILQGGLPMGTANDFNAQSLNNTKDTVASFRPTVIGANPPTLTSVSPNPITNYSALPLIMTLTGTELNTVTDLRVNGTPVSISSQDPTTLTFVMPNAIGIGNLSVIATNPTGSSSPLSLTVNGSHPSVFTAPILTSRGTNVDHDVYTDAGWQAIYFFSAVNSPSVLPGIASFNIGGGFSNFFQLAVLLADGGGLARLTFQIPLSFPSVTLYYQALTWDGVTPVAPLETSNSQGVIYL
jgi:hypothetical protein